MAPRIGLATASLTEFYQISLCQGVYEAATEAGYDLVCLPGDMVGDKGPGPDNTIFRLIPGLGLDGIIVLTAAISASWEEPGFRGFLDLCDGLPMVSVGAVLPDTPSVVADTRQAFGALVTHLRDIHGFRRFLYLGGPPSHQDNRIREEIFRDIVGGCECMTIYGTFTEESGFSLLRDLVRRKDVEPFPVIVAANDAMALGARRALEFSGNPAWARCAVTGFDDIPGASGNPGLTTVRQPLVAMGREAVSMLREVLEGRSPEEVRTLSSTPVFRASCGCGHTAGADGGNMKEWRDREQEHHALNTLAHSAGYLSITRTTRDCLTTMDTFASLLGLGDLWVTLCLPPSESDHPPLTISPAFRREGDRGIMLPADTPSLGPGAFLDTLLPPGSGHPRQIILVALLQEGICYGLCAFADPGRLMPFLSGLSSQLATALQRIHALEMQEERARELEQDVLRISEHERARMAQDLHDDICQRMAGLSFFLTALSRDLEGFAPEIMERMDAIRSALIETLELTRELARGMYPPDLDNLGLEAALDGLCAQTGRMAGRSIGFRSFRGRRDRSRLPRGHEVHLYRIAQEGVNNFLRHSGGQRCDVTIRTRDSHNGRDLILEIADDGKGTEGAIPGLGMRSMRYRASRMGGTFRTGPADGGGTRVEVIIPFPPPEPSPQEKP